jgi:zinc transport system ATP-binding protein
VPLTAGASLPTVLSPTPREPATVLDVDALTFAYRREPVIDCATFSVTPGEFVALVGPNGSGKSTLLRLVLGLLRPQAGTVRLLGEPPDRLRNRWRVGYVPQRSTVPDELPATAEEVVASGRLARRGWHRRPRPEDRAAVERALDTVGLLHTASRRVAELSGGQQQRVLIARALASDPELLILDEPVAGVDAASQSRFRDLLVSLVREAGATVFLVSHELGAVASDLDRILLLRHGKIAFDGPPADLQATGVSLGVHASDLPLWLEGLH